MICNSLNLQQKLPEGCREPCGPSLRSASSQTLCALCPDSRQWLLQPLHVEPQLHRALSGESARVRVHASPHLLPPGHLLSQWVQVGRELGSAEAIRKLWSSISETLTASQVWVPMKSMSEAQICV